jgi:penicillin-binding protein 1A
MGVRESRLDEVPSLALGTSPVTLREMVAAYGTIANNGTWTEPVLVMRVEDSQGKVLDAFVPSPSREVMPRAKALELVDVLRGTVDEGTGTAIRSRYGIQADVAGKTGTTQDNTDGWFLLMHPQLVAGAWVGFNDQRITMADAWGPGARSALPMVGDFFQQALRQKRIDARVEWDIPRPRPKPKEPERGELEKAIGDVVDKLFKIFQ